MGMVATDTRRLRQEPIGLLAAAAAQRHQDLMPRQAMVATEDQDKSSPGRKSRGLSAVVAAADRARRAAPRHTAAVQAAAMLPELPA